MRIISGGIDAWDALLVGDQSQANLSYFQNNISRLNTVQFIGDVGRSFIESAKEAYERFNGSEAMRLARALTRQVHGFFQPEVVRQLSTIGDFQSASHTMQRFVMANPAVRELYQQQRCEGYGDTYLDIEPNNIGLAHYDYRRAVEGVVQVTDEGYVAQFFPGDLREGDKELTYQDKTDIKLTWMALEAMLDAGMDDPTSQWNAKL
jgi:hypothetical protein